LAGHKTQQLILVQREWQGEKSFMTLTPEGQPVGEQPFQRLADHRTEKKSRMSLD
jgi:hypothetical protein